MTFNATVIRVLIASPTDAAHERDVIERTIHDWNASRSANSSVVLLPLRWESNAVPVFDVDAQSALNSQLVDKADLVVAVFNARLGSATARGVSGTAEEIERVHAAGKPVHVWFSTQPIPRDSDMNQVQLLLNFQQHMFTRGLVGNYSDDADLTHKVRSALEADVENIRIQATRIQLEEAPSRPAQPTASKSVLRASIRRTSGGAYKLTVRNRGDAPADALTVQLVSSSDDIMQIEGPQGVTLLDGAELSWDVWVSLASGLPALVRMGWQENGVATTLEQAI